MQYAVDSRLDELLARLWQAVTEPPMAINPFPKVLHVIRCVSRS